MTSLTAENTILALLKQAKELAEIRDGSGNLVGFYVPADLYKADLRAEAVRNTDHVKIFRGEHRSRTVHTTRQVFEHLKSLTEDEATRSHLQQYIDGFVQRDEGEDFLSSI